MGVVPKRTKEVLDSLNEYGYVWNYDNCYIDRYQASGRRTILSKIEVIGKYDDNYQTNFLMRRSSGGQAYTIRFYHKCSSIFDAHNLYNLKEVFDNYVYYSKILNKIRDKEIVSVKTFFDDHEKFTILSCKDNIHLIFVRTTERRFQVYEFIEEVKEENVKNLINRTKLIGRL